MDPANNQKFLKAHYARPARYARGRYAPSPARAMRAPLVLKYALCAKKISYGHIAENGIFSSVGSGVDGFRRGARGGTAGGGGASATWYNLQSRLGMADGTGAVTVYRPLFHYHEDFFLSGNSPNSQNRRFSRVCNSNSHF